MTSSGICYTIIRTYNILYAVVLQSVSYRVNWLRSRMIIISRLLSILIIIQFP